MQRSEANRPSRLTGQQALDHFGRKCRKRCQAAEKAGNRKQFPGQRKIRIEVKKADGNADQIAANHIGRQGAERNGNQQRVQRQPEQPARPGTEGGAGADGQKIECGEIVQG